MWVFGPVRTIGPHRKKRGKMAGDRDKRGVGGVYDILNSEGCSEVMCNGESNGCLELS